MSRATSARRRRRPVGFRLPWGDYAAYGLFVLALTAMGLASDRWVLIVPFFFALALHARYGAKTEFKLTLIRGLLLAIPFAALTREWEVTT